MAYTCWGADQEDLTDIVKAKVTQDAIVAAAGPAVAAAAQRATAVAAGGGQRWTVLVTCTSGHENIFKGVGAP